MSAIDLIRHPNYRLDVFAGLIDGILNALALAAGRLLHTGGEGATLSLALRVSVAAGAELFWQRQSTARPGSGGSVFLSAESSLPSSE